MLQMSACNLSVTVWDCRREKKVFETALLRLLMFDYIQGSVKGFLLGLSVHTHLHSLQWNAILQQIRGWDAGVIKTAYRVKL